MSLEESMSTLAESNLKLAAAMTNYANVMQSIASSNPGAIVAAPAGATEAAAPADKPKARRRTQAEIAADAKAEVAASAEAATEIDPFAEDGAVAETREITGEDIRNLIMQVKANKTEDALAIIKAVGAETISKIAEKDYPKVVELCAKKGVTL